MYNAGQTGMSVLLTKYGENVPPYIGEYIKGLGYSIIEIYQKEYKGMSDDEIFDPAIKEERVIITFNRHFSN